MESLLRQFGLILLAASVSMVAQFCLKQGVKGEAVSILSVEQFIGFVQRVLTTPLLLLGYTLSAVTGLLWLVIISRLDISYATPLFVGTYFVLLLIVSTTLLHEAVTPWHWAGTLLIVAGIATLSKTT